MEYYFFGVGRGKIGVRHAALLNRIAGNYDKNGYFVSAHMPEGDRYWFAIRNNGVPHDQNTAGKIIKEAETKKTMADKSVTVGSAVLSSTSASTDARPSGGPKA